MKVCLDTSPLQNENSIRGVGVYTRFLKKELEELQNEDFTLVDESKKADVIHYPFFDLFFPTLPIFQLSNSKIVVTIHDVIPLLFPKKYPKGIRARLNLLRQKKALSSVDAIITDSETSSSDIHAYLNVSVKKINPIYLAGNPAIQPVSDLDQKKVRQKYKLPKKYILYVGDINFNKNIPNLIQTLEYLPEEFHLVCVGKNFRRQPIPEWQAIHNAARTFGNRFCCVNTIEAGNSDLSAIYSAAEVYVQPSLAEGFGLPILEAMQAETLVVSTENSSLIEVGGKVVEFVKPDSLSIANGIKEILSWSAKEKQHRINLAKKWANTFSWTKTAKQTLEVYQKVYSQS